MRFLFTRRWLLFGAAVVVAAWLAMQLGQWQFHRLDERRALNALVAANLDSDPVPAAELMGVGEEPSHDDEWRRVILHGTWDDSQTLVLKYQTRDGRAGVDVATPLRTADGSAVLVDRGWMPTSNIGSQRPDPPAADAGQVTVIGWVRRDGSGSSTRIDQMATRALSGSVAASVLPYPVYSGFVDLQTQSPPPAHPLTAIELPDDTSEGPHFFYGLQWWFFGALAIGGFGYLVVDEARRARREAAAPPAETVAAAPPVEVD